MKKLIATAIMMTVFFITAHAADESIVQCSVNIETKIVTITGDFTQSNASAKCNLLVLNPGYSVQDLPDASFTGIQKQAETVLNEKGVLEIKFPINETNLSESGFCPVYVRLQNDSELAKNVLEASFFYSTPTHIENAIKDLNSSRNLSDLEVAKKIEDYKNILSYSFPPYEKIDKLALAKALKAEKTPQFSETDFSEIQTWIKAQSIIEALNQGENTVIFDGDTILYDEYTKLSGIDEEKNVTVYSLYSDSLNETGRANVRQAISGKSLSDTEALKKAFAKAVVVEAIRNYASGGYGHISSVLQENAMYAELDLSKYSSSADADKSVLNANASDISYLQIAINNSAPVLNQGGGSSGGGGGGGSVPFISGNGSGSANDTAISELYIDKTKYGLVDMAVAEWAVEAVDALIAKGVISQPEDNKFRPNDKITREEFVKLAVIAFDVKAEGETSGFWDVTADDWSYEYIYAAKNAGIIDGMDDGSFGKKAFLSRQDMAVILKRCCNFKGITLNEEGEEIVFSDWASISDYAKEAIASLTKSEIINGMDDGSFRPLEGCTRAQCAKVIYLMIKE